MRHKRTYFVKSEKHPNCYEMIMVARKQKPRSLIRKIMNRAWVLNWIQAIDKRLKI